MEVETRLWSKVNKTSKCWLWTASLDTNGYGQFSIKNTPRRPAHKVVYELLKDKVPKGLTLDHLCRVRSCVNPDHLEIVTAAVNTMRGNSIGAVNKAKTHCKRGHPLSGYNKGAVILHGTLLGRYCRTCVRKQKLARYHRVKVLKDNK